jgi:hypothetical protein
LQNLQSLVVGLQSQLDNMLHSSTTSVSNKTVRVVSSSTSSSSVAYKLSTPASTPSTNNKCSYASIPVCSNGNKPIFSSTTCDYNCSNTPPTGYTEGSSCVYNTKGGADCTVGPSIADSRVFYVSSSTGTGTSSTSTGINSTDYHVLCSAVATSITNFLNNSGPFSAIGTSIAAVNAAGIRCAGNSSGSNWHYTSCSDLTATISKFMVGGATFNDVGIAIKDTTQENLQCGSPLQFMTGDVNGDTVSDCNDLRAIVQKYENGTATLTDIQTVISALSSQGLQCNSTFISSCTSDIKTCSNGNTVVRDPQNYCLFKACSSGSTTTTTSGGNGSASNYHCYTQYDCPNATSYYCVPGVNGAIGTCMLYSGTGTGSSSTGTGTNSNSSTGSSCYTQYDCPGNSPCIPGVGGSPSLLYSI